MNIKWLMVALLLVFAGATQLEAEPVSPYVLEARDIVKQFFGSLKEELQAALKEGGPVTAISICKLRAPRITKEFSSLSGWYIARTSLRLRNPNNAPDEWEHSVLQQFEARKAAGEDVANMDYGEELLIADKRIFRYMKAIRIEELCLNCHGGSVKPGILRILKQLYPDDQATGFQVGDIRGAFTLARSL
jgi:hypothetical protein